MKKKLLLAWCLSMLMTVGVIAQEHELSGAVTSEENGMPIPGVSVKLKGSTISTTTGANGRYLIKLPAKSGELIFTYVGYKSLTKEIEGQSFLNILLVPEIRGLDEIVVTGYQQVKRKDLTSSVVTIAGKEFADKPIPSFLQLLQGKSPGVQVTTSSGRPGAGVSIRMRGSGSINASSEPLIIIDGLAVATVTYNMLNPNDIEDVSILKDAGATAIYGSRGSNGVILVTTKRGQSGEPVFSYSFNYGISNVQKLKNLELMDAAQKLQFEYETGVFVNPQLTNLINAQKKTGDLAADATLFNIRQDQRQSMWDQLIAGGDNWEKVLLRKNAKSQNHDFSISGGGDKMRYFFSLNKSNNPGVLENSFWNRTGGRLNVEYQAKEWFKIATNIGVTHTNENMVREINNGQALYTASQTLNPYEPLYNADGTYNYTSAGQNPLETTLFNPDLYNRLANFGNLSLEFKPLKSLTLRSQVGVNYNTLITESYLQPGSYLAQTVGFNQKRDYGNRDLTYVFTNTANWNQTIGKHNFTILAGTEFNKNRFYEYSLTNQNLPSALVNTLENGSKPTQATSSRTDWALISYFTSGQYDFDKTYFLSLSARRDGSSRFGALNRFANFWSIGAAWDISKESFFKVPQVSNLKLRGSLGTSGNPGTGLYSSLGTYTYAINYNAQPASSPNTIANPRLTWESNDNLDLALEFGLFNSRITGSTEYYHRKTKNLLFPVNLSQTTGFSSYQGNVGSIVNQGIELSLRGDVIRTADLTWRLFVNYSNNKNRVTSLYVDNSPAENTNSYARLKVGEPVFTYFMADWAGVNPQTGKNEWYDENGIPSDVWKAGYAKLQNGKSPEVKYFGSFGTSVNYKQFDLSAEFYYSGGNYIYNLTRQIGASEGNSAGRNQLVEALDYWKNPGDVKRYANLADKTQHVTFASDKYLEKGDYLSLRDLTIGYTLDDKLTKRLHLKGLRVFVQGTNLWISTKFHGNPEVGQANRENSAIKPGIMTLYNYPQTSVYSAGVSIKL